MTQKAFMAAGIELSKPIRLGDMERALEFPACMFGLRLASRYTLDHPLTFDTLVYFPGNERHGIWSAKQLMTVVPPTYSPGYPDLSTGDHANGPGPRGIQAPPRPKKVSNTTSLNDPAGGPKASGTETPARLPYRSGRSGGSRPRPGTTISTHCAASPPQPTNSRSRARHPRASRCGCRTPGSVGIVNTGDPTDIPLFHRNPP